MFASAALVAMCHVACAKLPNGQSEQSGQDASRGVDHGDGDGATPSHTDTSNANGTSVTPYTYVEPTPFLRDSNTFGALNAISAPWLSADGTKSFYLAGAQNVQGTQSFAVYQSSNGTKWKQVGQPALMPGVCAYALAALPTIYNGNANRRLLMVATACQGTSSAPCVGLSYTSDDGGSTWSQSGNATSAYATDFCSSTLLVDDVGQVHYLYSTNSASSPNAIVQNISTNGGQSWGSKRTVINGKVHPRWPTGVIMGTSGSHRLALFYEEQLTDGADDLQIFGASSIDNGSTWSAPFVVLKPASTESLASPYVALADANTIVLSVQRHTRLQDAGHQVQLAFAPMPSSGLPTFGERTAIVNSPLFPATAVALSGNDLGVMSLQTGVVGITVLRVGLRR